MCTIHVPSTGVLGGGLVEAEEGVGFLGTAVIGGCEPRVGIVN